MFNLNAVRYLRNIGLLDNGKCPMCGIREDEANYALSYQNGAHFMFARNVISNTHNRKSKNGAVLVVLQFL